MNDINQNQKTSYTTLIMSSIEKILKKENIKFFLIGIISALIIFFIIGILSDVIPNKRYTRMIPATGLDMFFLFSISIMLGIYIGLFFYLTKQRQKQKNAAAYTGAASGALAIFCPTCIQFLVLIFGTAALMAYLEPLRPYIGFFGIALIGFGLYKEIEIIKKCKKCIPCKK